MLNEDFNDKLDSLNDDLTELTTEEFDGVNEILNLFSVIEETLSQYGLKLDYDDIEGLFQDWEEPTEFEAVNVIMPLYDLDNGDTSYNLSITYACNEPGSNQYMVDIEVQYEWEAEDEIETVFIELGEE